MSRRRKRAEERCGEKRGTLRMLVENQGEGIVDVDLAEQFIFANPAADEIFGVRREPSSVAIWPSSTE